MAIRIQMGPRENRSMVAAVLGGLICTGLSVAGFVIVFSGAQLSGGIPLLPQALNQGIGRTLFGLGALFTAALAAYAFHDVWRLHRERSTGGTDVTGSPTNRSPAPKDLNG